MYLELSEIVWKSWGIWCGLESGDPLWCWDVSDVFEMLDVIQVVIASCALGQSSVYCCFVGDVFEWSRGDTWCNWSIWVCGLCTGRSGKARSALYGWLVGDVLEWIGRDPRRDWAGWVSEGDEAAVQTARQMCLQPTFPGTSLRAKLLVVSNISRYCYIVLIFHRYFTTTCCYCS